MLSSVLTAAVTRAYYGRSENATWGLSGWWVAQWWNTGLSPPANVPCPVPVLQLTGDHLGLALLDQVAHVNW